MLCESREGSRVVRHMDVGWGKSTSRNLTAPCTAAVPWGHCLSEPLPSHLERPRISPTAGWQVQKGHFLNLEVRIRSNLQGPPKLRWLEKTYREVITGEEQEVFKRIVLVGLFKFLNDSFIIQRLKKPGLFLLCRKNCQSLIISSHFSISGSFFSWRISYFLSIYVSTQ